MYIHVLKKSTSYITYHKSTCTGIHVCTKWINFAIHAMQKSIWSNTHYNLSNKSPSSILQTFFLNLKVTFKIIIDDDTFQFLQKWIYMYVHKIGRCSRKHLDLFKVIRIKAPCGYRYPILSALVIFSQCALHVQLSTKVFLQHINSSTTGWVVTNCRLPLNTIAFV